MTASNHSARAEGPRPEHYNLAEAFVISFLAAVGHCINWEDLEGLRFVSRVLPLNYCRCYSKSNAVC